MRKRLTGMMTVIAMAAMMVTASCGRETSAGSVQPTQNPNESGTLEENDGEQNAGGTLEENDGEQNAGGEVTPIATPDPEAVQSVVLEEGNVKLLGRTQLLLDKNLLCAYSGSGVEFDFTGKHLEVEMVGDSAANENNLESCARVAVYVDGERVEDRMLTKKLNMFIIIDSAEAATFRVRIVKLSETAQSFFAIRPIKIKGDESIVPTERKAHTIEFIGDSITCGYGVDDEEASHSFSTQTEDATKAYAIKTAEKLDADYSLVSISGHGIISGYTNDPDKKSQEQVMSKYYEKLGCSYTNYNNMIQPQTIAWDFAKFVPEVIVINLGTNDASYCKQDAAKQQEYIDGYAAFLKQVRSKNPDAEIFCTLGLMGQDLCEAMDRAVVAYTAETGDAKVHTVWLDVQDGALGIAADWHPTEANHEKAAEKLTGEIRAVMGW